MAKYPIGLIIRQIVDEKTISPTQLSKVLGISKQAVYNNFKRTDMNNSELIKWAEALGVTTEELVSRSTMGSIPEENRPESNYLLEHLTNLEEQFRALSEQLRVKDKQMEGMQRTIDVLLGKSKDVMQLLATRVIPMYSESEAQA